MVNRRSAEGMGVHGSLSCRGCNSLANRSLLSVKRERQEHEMKTASAGAASCGVSNEQSMFASESTATCSLCAATATISYAHRNEWGKLPLCCRTTSSRFCSMQFLPSFPFPREVAHRRIGRERDPEAGFEKVKKEEDAKQNDCSNTLTQRHTR